MYIMKKILTLLAIAAIAGLSVRANNIQVANISITDQNTTNRSSIVRFDVSWENSWRTSNNENNYDGAWLFVKFRKKSAQLWQHATLNYASPGNATVSGHVQPTGSTITTPADGKGVWIYRLANGIGANNFINGGLKWNYGVDGVLDNDSVEVKVFALEMVYIPQGSFFAGSGGNETNCFRTGASTNPFLVPSESSINVANTAGNLYYTNVTGFGGDISGPVPAAFPKGFNAFWMMKYESSQQQYADFLNNLDLARANARYAGLFTGTHPNLAAPFAERAYVNASYSDASAFYDWAALRPCTELEYEKAARGFNQMATPNEYAWGNTSITPPAVTNDGEANETAGGNANYGIPNYRALRTGAFANDTSGRVKSGAGYYGIMELSGNAFEPVITVGTGTGRLFTKANGDGKIDATGEADVATWPMAVAGWGIRGGYYGSAAALLRISDRSNASSGGGYGFDQRFNFSLRAVRTAE